MVLKEQIRFFLSLPDFEIKIRDYHVLLPYPSGPAIYLHSWRVNIAISFSSDLRALFHLYGGNNFANTVVPGFRALGPSMA